MYPPARIVRNEEFVFRISYFPTANNGNGLFATGQAYVAKGKFSHRSAVVKTMARQVSQIFLATKTRRHEEKLDADPFSAIESLRRINFADYAEGKSKSKITDQSSKIIKARITQIFFATKRYKID